MITKIKTPMTRISFLMSLCIMLCLNCISQEIGIPALISPINGSTITQNPPTFIWQSVEGVNEYGLQVATDSLFTWLIINVTCIADTNYTPLNSLDSGDYFWRVCAIEDG